MARLSLSLTAPTILMLPQGTVLEGTPFTVERLGPNNAGGNYELRYVSGQSETVLAWMPLAVAAN